MRGGSRVEWWQWVELGVAGNVAGDEFGGGRSSGEVELVARGTERRVVWCVELLGVR